MSSQRYSMEYQNVSRPAAQLLYVTCATSDQDWHSMEHSHYFSELFFVTKGTGYFQIEGEKISVGKNDMILINPNIPHTELGNRANPWEYIALGIEGVQFCSLDTSSVYDYSIHKIQGEHKEIFTYLDFLTKEAKEKKSSYQSVCQNLMELLLLCVARAARQDFLSAPRQKTSRECRLVEQYINDHYAQDITLETLSSLVHINKYYLVHAFKSYKGISPINYLLQKRVEEARHLLDTTNYPVTKIAQIAGFSSQSYFSQAFKRMTGISPNAYRKLQKTEEN